MSDHYDGNMDVECIAICDAINRIPGLHTTESCCGHGKERFRIFLDIENLNVLSKLLFWCYPRHIGFRWNCMIEAYDRNKICIWIESESLGEVAYREAETIAKALQFR